MLKLLAAFLILQAYAVAGQVRQDKYAPLPEKVVNAKTVFYINDTTSSRFGDDLYQELRKWNRWQVVKDKKKADLILVLSQRDNIEGTIATATAKCLREWSASRLQIGTSLTLQIQTEPPVAFLA